MVAPRRACIHPTAAAAARPATRPENSSRPGMCLRARGSRACRRRRSPPPRPPRRGRAAARRRPCSTRADRSVSSPPSVLRVRMSQPHRDQRTRCRDRAAGAAAPRGSACRRCSCARRGSRSICASLLKVLSICAVARDDLALQRGRVEQRLARQRVHAAHQVGEVALDDEVGAVLLERLHRPGRAAGARGRARWRMLLPVRSGFCSEPDSANSRSMIFWREHEPGIVVAGRHDVLQRAERVEAGEQRHRQRFARARRARATTGRAGCGCRGGSRSALQFWMPSV